MNDMQIDLNVLDIETTEQYRAQKGKCLTGPLLMDFDECPWLYHRQISEQIRDRREYLVDRAAHVRILEGREVYEQTFALGGPINQKTGKPFDRFDREFSKWLKKQDGKPRLEHDQVDLIEQMAAGLAQNDLAVDLLLYGRSNGVVRTNYCGLPCQAWFDWVHPHRGIVDFQPCYSLDLTDCELQRSSCQRQLAFDRALLAQRLDGLLVPVYVIGIERDEPFRCGVWQISDEVLAKSQAENEASIAKLIECQQHGRWSTNFEELRIVAAS
ncbi:MAG: PD-(D/E)XK nuclease-like domain-containing protein [Sedimentisphaerales bacterium]|nr:PD-(D/E)XK nuclease-like domain-containing protein [Sedimentisphaerales bacterium]